MNAQRFTKAQKREIRRLSGVAYEREMCIAAQALQQEFERWRQGQIDVFSLNDSIHKFHNGISRDLYQRYAMGDEDLSVGSAIGRGLLKESEVDPQVLEILRGFVELVRQNFQEQQKTS